METINARCGHPVPAVGTPGSMARRAAMARTCEHPRCQSGLPAKFTDAECAAYVRLSRSRFRGWTVDYVDKSVAWGGTKSHPQTEHTSLVTFAAYCGL